MLDVYIEMGSKKTMAGALEWPGWARNGKTTEQALDRMIAYIPRYRVVTDAAGLDFNPPTAVHGLTVVEEVAGDSSTDFGGIGPGPSIDAAPLDEAEYHRLLALLEAAWSVSDAAFLAARGKEMTFGSRGGGRDWDKMRGHIVQSERAYLSKLGGKLARAEYASIEDEIAIVRETIRETLPRSFRGEIEPFGPRGGARWPVRGFVRKAAWHVLDHTWELQDRTG